MVWGTDWPQNCHLIKIHSFLSLDTYPSQIFYLASTQTSIPLQRLWDNVKTWLCPRSQQRSCTAMHSCAMCRWSIFFIFLSQPSVPKSCFSLGVSILQNWRKGTHYQYKASSEELAGPTGTWGRSHWSYTIFLLSLPSSTYFSSAVWEAQGWDTWLLAKEWNLKEESWQSTSGEAEIRVHRSWRAHRGKRSNARETPPSHAFKSFFRKSSVLGSGPSIWWSHRPKNVGCALLPAWLCLELQPGLPRASIRRGWQGTTHSALGSICF